jgi:uncharacterized membrane protein YjfL (UPF0719 family)
MDKKKLFLILLGFLISPLIISAQVQSCPVGGACITDLTPIIRSVEMAAGLIFGGVAVICFIIAGVLFLTANGEPEKIKQARSALYWGVAGVVVGILAFSIIAIVSNILAPGSQNTNI